MAENKSVESLPEVRAAIAALSPEEKELLAAVQDSPFRMTDAQHTDILYPPELLSASDPVPFGQYAAKEEQGYFTEHGYISLSDDEWQHEKSAERTESDRKPTIRERLEQNKKECSAKPHTATKSKNEQEL